MESGLTGNLCSVEHVARLVNNTLIFVRVWETAEIAHVGRDNPRLLAALTDSSMFTCLVRFCKSTRHHIKTFSRFLRTLFKKHFAVVVCDDYAHSTRNVVVQVEAAVRTLPLTATHLRLNIFAATLRTSRSDFIKGNGWSDGSFDTTDF